MKGVDGIKMVIHLVNIYWAYTTVGIVLGTVEKILRAILKKKFWIHLQLGNRKKKYISKKLRNKWNNYLCFEYYERSMLYDVVEILREPTLLWRGDI